MIEPPRNRQHNQRDDDMGNTDVLDLLFLLVRKAFLSLASGMKIPEARPRLSYQKYLLSVRDWISTLLPSMYPIKIHRALWGPTPTMTLVPASEKLEDKSTTSGLFVVRVTSRRLTRACGQSGFPFGLISDSNFQNGGLNERAAVCGVGCFVVAA